MPPSPQKCLKSPALSKYIFLAKQVLTDINLFSSFLDLQWQGQRSLHLYYHGHVHHDCPLYRFHLLFKINVQKKKNWSPWQCWGKWQGDYWQRKQIGQHWRKLSDQWCFLIVACLSANSIKAIKWYCRGFFAKLNFEKYSNKKSDKNEAKYWSFLHKILSNFILFPIIIMHKLIVVIIFCKII